MRHRILLVDDEPNILMGLKRALHKEPFEILTAQSAREALNLLETTEIDVVVSDQDMPGLSGTKFLRLVHKGYPNTVRFMLTGKATLDVAVEAINEGAISRFFTKPCNEVDLAVTIRQALQHKDLITEAWRLLTKVRQQEVILDRLEKESPGITHVARTSQGAIILDDHIPDDYNQFIEELHKGLGGTEPDG